jgi:hypothetical protein
MWLSCPLKESMPVASSTCCALGLNKIIIIIFSWYHVSGEDPDANSVEVTKVYY